MKVIKTKLCKKCDELFEVNINNKRSNNKLFCSSTCAKSYNGSNNKGRLRTKEFKENMSIKNSGKDNPFFGKKHTENSLLKMSKTSQWSDNKFKFCNMTETEKEIFDGIMISDGSLNNSRISARLTLGFKYSETIDRIINDLSSINFLKPWKYESNIDKRTKKKYINFYTKSNFYRDLLFEYNRWYVNNIKIIPEDIKLTSLMCYWWFVCDGYISKNNVHLCTDSFNNNDLEFLKLNLIKIGFDVSVTKNKRIFIKKKSSLDFLNWISNNIIQKEYLYKWDIKKITKK